MTDKLKWWGYQHINGSIAVKRYLDDLSLHEANESDFVMKVYGPIEADCVRDAMLVIHKEYI